MVEWAEITTWYVVVNLVIMFVFTIACAIGGGRDLIYLFKELHQKKVDELDDGRVLDNPDFTNK